MYSKILLIIICTLILHLPTIQTSSTGCHYSCLTCTEPFHQFCKTCQNGQEILVVHSQKISNNQQGNSHNTGICSSSLPQSKPNVLGIILILSALIFIPFTSNKLLFNMVLTFQSFSLLSFLQIGWLNPLSYILNSFQYFMIFNILTTKIKQHNNKINQFSYYYLNQYFIQPQIYKSLILLGFINIIVIVLLVVVVVIINVRDSPLMDKYKNSTICSTSFLKTAFNVLSCIFFMIIQQTVLSIFVSLQFQHPSPQPPTITILVIYAMFIIFFISIITKYSITLFPNKLSQIHSLTKKIIYPILTIIQFNNQYSIIIFMLCFFLLQNFWNYKTTNYSNNKKNIMNIIQLSSILTFIILFWVDFFSQEDIAPLVLTYILTGLLGLSLALFYFQAIRSALQKIIHKKVSQSANYLPQNSTLNRSQSNQISYAKKQRTSTQESKNASNQSRKRVSDDIEVQQKQVQQKQIQKKDGTVQNLMITANQTKYKKQSKRKKIKFNQNQKLKQIRKIYGVQ